MNRLKYLVFFAGALVSAFFTYHSFLFFKGEAVLNMFIIFINTAGLMILWFLSFTAKSRFIQNNLVIFLVIPAAAIHILNIIVHFSEPETNVLGLVSFIFSSSTLMYFSYRTSLLEKKF